MLRQCDHLDGKRPVQLRAVEVWPAPEWRSWVSLYGKEISDDPDLNGKAVGVQAYKDALKRPGAVTKTSARVCAYCRDRLATCVIECRDDGSVFACDPCEAANNKGCPVRPLTNSPGAGNPTVAPASGDPTGAGRFLGVPLGPC